MVATRSLCAIVACSLVAANASCVDDSTFVEYKIKFNKTYSKDEELARCEQVLRNAAEIALLNKENGVADEEEFTLHARSDALIPAGNELPVDYALPFGEEGEDEEESNSTGRALRGKTVDWRKSHKVTSVLDQGQCETCWAYASVAALGSFEMIHRHHISSSLRGKRGVSTVVRNIGHGCGGTGSPSYAMQYLARRTGRTAPTRVITVPKSRMKSYLDKAPVVIMIRQERNFNNWYGSRKAKRTIPGSHSGRPTHVILAVGYHSNGDLIVQNSWGKSWGDNGFAIMRRNDFHVAYAFA